MSANRSGREPGATLKAGLGADSIGARDHLALSKDEQNTAAALIFALLPWPRLIGWASFEGGKRLGRGVAFRCLFATCEGFLCAVLRAQVFGHVYPACYACENRASAMENRECVASGAAYCWRRRHLRSCY
jgi:hypothetical protein